MTTVSRRILGTAAAIGASLLLALGGSVTAQAAPSVPAPPKAAPGQSCWYELDTGRSLCVASGTDLSAAVSKAYGVQLTTAATRSSTTAVRPAATAAPAASVVLSQIFDDAGYGGASFVMSVSNGNCATSAYGFADLNTIGWYGRVSSFKSFNGCRTAIFTATNFGGSQYGYTTNASSLGSFNDQAKSWRVSG